MKNPPPIIECLKLGGQVVDINAYLTKPYEDIREAALEIPAVISFLGAQRALAVERVLRAEREWKKTEAQVYFELKEGQFVAQGYGSKPTEEALKRAVLLDTRVEEAAVKYEVRKRLLDTFTETIAALKLKIDLTRSTESTRRLAEAEEMQ